MMQIINTIFSFIGLLVVAYSVSYAIAAGVYRARAKYPHVVNHNWNLSVPSISTLRAKLMEEYLKSEKPAGTEKKDEQQ